MTADENLVAQQLKVRKRHVDAFPYPTDGIVVRHDVINSPEDVEDSIRAADNDPVSQAQTSIEGCSEVGDIAVAEETLAREDCGAPEQVEDDKMEDVVSTERLFGTAQQVADSDQIDNVVLADQHFGSDLDVIGCDDLLLDMESVCEIISCYPEMLNETLFPELGDTVNPDDLFNASSESGSASPVSPSLPVDTAHPQETDARPELKPPLAPSVVSRTEAVVHARIPSTIGVLHPGIASDGAHHSIAACGTSYQVAFGLLVHILLLSVSKMN